MPGVVPAKSSRRIRRLGARRGSLATARDVAVDVLLVLVQESDPGIFRLTGHDPQTVDHLFPILFWLLAIGNKEGEDADVRRSHDIGGAQRAPETLQVRPEGFRHRHFAYRGAYGGYPDAALRGRGLYPVQLIVRQVEHVGVPHA